MQPFYTWKSKKPPRLFTTLQQVEKPALITFSLNNAFKKKIQLASFTDCELSKSCNRLISLHQTD